MGAGGVKANKEITLLKQHVEVAENKLAAALPQRSFARPATRSLCPRHPGRRMPFARRRAGRAGCGANCFAPHGRCRSSLSRSDARPNATPRAFLGARPSESAARSLGGPTRPCDTAAAATMPGGCGCRFGSAAAGPCFMTRIEREARA